MLGYSYMLRWLLRLQVVLGEAGDKFGWVPIT